jgi:HEPN domain-containing protein
MSDAERLKETERWLRFAREDLVAAERTVERRELPRHACFLSQQAAEKVVKAALVFLQVEFPHRHDLALLRTCLPDDWLLKKTPTDLDDLSQWAVEGRYPGIAREASEDDAETAARLAREAYEAAIQDFKRHGYEPDAQRAPEPDDEAEDD